MPNTLLTISMITREALRVLENNLTFTKQVSRYLDDKFAQTGAKIGDTIQVRKPIRVTVRSGATVSVQDITETAATVTLANQKGVDLSITSADLALKLDDFSDRIIKPAVTRLANQIDADGLALYREIPWAVRKAGGGVPTAEDEYLEAGVILSEEAAPLADRKLVLSPRMEAKIISALKGLFHAGPEITKQYESGHMGRALGYEWYMDQNVQSHTVGVLGGTPLVNGASQTGSTLVTDGWNASTANVLRRGDVFEIDGVYAVNPVSGESTGRLRRFVATADVSSNGSGQATIPIYPPIVTSGAGRTVTTSPADNAAITAVGTASLVAPQALAFHPDAFVLACADLPLPGGVHMAARVSDDQLGLSIRAIQAYSITDDLFVLRLDVLYGWAVVRPELAVRIYGA